IGHAYDLEHVWVHVAANGAVIKVEASSHGGRKPMEIAAGLPEMEGGRPIVYAEAGKHAHWAHPDHMQAGGRQKLGVLCSSLAGIEGVHLGNSSAQRGDYDPTPRDHRLARLKMRADAFAPSHRYRPAAMPRLLPWPELEAEIPQRVKAEMARLRQ